MNDDYSIIPVLTASERTAFAEFGVEASIAHGYSIPYYLESEQHNIAPDKNALIAETQCKAWLLVNNGNVVGRIAAMVNPDIEDKPGLIGLFECLEERFASTLIKTAVNDLSSRGCLEIYAPVDFSIWNRYRFKLASAPACYVGDVENPEFYVKAFEAHGFSAQEHYVSQIIGTENIPQLEEACRPSLMQLAKIGLQALPLKQFDTDTILSEIWSVLSRNYNTFPLYSAISKKDFISRFRSKAFLFNRELSAFIVDKEQNIIGIGLIMYDYRKALGAMKGKTHWLAKLRFLRYKGHETIIPFAHLAMDYKTARKVTIQVMKSGERNFSIAKMAIGYLIDNMKKSHGHCALLFSSIRSESPTRHAFVQYQTSDIHYALFHKRLTK